MTEHYNPPINVRIFWRNSENMLQKQIQGVIEAARIDDCIFYTDVHGKRMAINWANVNMIEIEDSVKKGER